MKLLLWAAHFVCVWIPRGIGLPPFHRFHPILRDGEWIEKMLETFAERQTL